MSKFPRASRIALTLLSSPSADTGSQFLWSNRCGATLLAADFFLSEFVLVKSNLVVNTILPPQGISWEYLLSVQNLSVKVSLRGR